MNITLSPIALKIFCKVLLNRIEPVLDGVLRRGRSKPVSEKVGDVMIRSLLLGI